MSMLGKVMVETEFIASIVKRDVFYDCWGLVAAVVVGGGCCCTPVARDGTVPLVKRIVPTL